MNFTAELQQLPWYFKWSSLRIINSVNIVCKIAIKPNPVPSNICWSSHPYFFYHSLHSYLFAPRWHGYILSFSSTWIRKSMQFSHVWIHFYPTILYPREKTIWTMLGSNRARQLHNRARPLRPSSLTLKVLGDFLVNMISSGTFQLRCYTRTSIWCSTWDTGVFPF